MKGLPNHCGQSEQKRERERERERGGWELDSPEHISWTKSSVISVLGKWHFTGLETSLRSLPEVFSQRMPEKQ